VTVSAPAKINISLAVGPLRDDGFHELRTVFHAVDLRDTVIATPSDSLTLALSGPEVAGLPGDETNLAWRAATVLAERFDIRPRAALTLSKSIPIAAGLAGGSADAAATLVACARVWDLPVSDAMLAEFAAELGSDVPFALLGGTAVGTGRGEVLEPLPSDPSLHWVLAASWAGLSTPAVYRELDRLRATSVTTATDSAADLNDSDVRHAVEALAAGELRIHRTDLTALGACMRNDLQVAALSLAPELASTLRAGAELGALGSIVSGSGPTCVFLAADAAAARRLATGLAASGTCRWARAVSGNAPGALGARTQAIRPFEHPAPDGPTRQPEED
jgi:4-diphosphocytidyl-2-C-methyl-D-erythritol kinase